LANTKVTFAEIIACLKGRGQYSLVRHIVKAKYTEEWRVVAEVSQVTEECGGLAKGRGGRWAADGKVGEGRLKEER
jgi:hypothetical protein